MLAEAKEKKHVNFQKGWKMTVNKVFIESLVSFLVESVKIDYSIEVVHFHTKNINHCLFFLAYSTTEE